MSPIPAIKNGAVFSRLALQVLEGGIETAEAAEALKVAGSSFRLGKAFGIAGLALTAVGAGVWAYCNRSTILHPDDIAPPSDIEKDEMWRQLHARQMMEMEGLTPQEAFQRAGLNGQGNLPAKIMNHTNSPLIPRASGNSPTWVDVKNALGLLEEEMDAIPFEMEHPLDQQIQALRTCQSDLRRIEQGKIQRTPEGFLKRIEALRADLAQRMQNPVQYSGAYLFPQYSDLHPAVDALLRDMRSHWPTYRRPVRDARRLLENSRNGETVFIKSVLTHAREILVQGVANAITPLSAYQVETMALPEELTREGVTETEKWNFVHHEMDQFMALPENGRVRFVISLRENESLLTPEELYQWFATYLGAREEGKSGLNALSARFQHLIASRDSVTTRQERAHQLKERLKPWIADEADIRSDVKARLQQIMRELSTLDVEDKNTGQQLLRMEKQFDLLLNRTGVPIRIVGGDRRLFGSGKGKRKGLN